MDLNSWLESALAFRGGEPGRDLLPCLLGEAPHMLFQKQGEEFHLERKSGYGSASFSYQFLESRPDLWMEALEQGAVRIPGDQGYLGEGSVWVAVDRPGNPGWLLVAEISVEEEGAGLLLQLALGSLSRSASPLMASDQAHRTGLPVWLEEAIPPLKDAPSPLLLVSEVGSGAEELIQALLDLRFRGGPDPIFFHPGRLSEAVQLREIFGETPAGARIGGSSAGVPMVRRKGGVVVIQETAELSDLVQLRLLGLFSSGEPEQFWVFETSRDLKAMVEAGKFQRGLYSILKEGEVVIPPVRARKERIREEALRLLDELRRRYRREITLEEEALAALESHDWPGNWRELKGTLESAFFLCSGTFLTAEDLRLGEWDPAEDPDDLNLRKRSRELEKKLLLRAYALHGGNQVQMARALGISRGSLQYKMEKFGMM